MKIVNLALAMTALSSFANSADPLANFKPSTISDSFRSFEESIPTPLEDAVVYATPNHRVLLTLQATGRIRPISQKTSEFLKDYVSKNMVPLSFASVFTHEIELIEGARVTWALLQESLTSPYIAELTSGGLVELRAIVAGLNKGDIVLLTIAFKTL